LLSWLIKIFLSIYTALLINPHLKIFRKIDVLRASNHAIADVQNEIGWVLVRRTLKTQILEIS